MQLQVFTYEDVNPFQFTALEINGEGYFVAAEACKLLGISDIQHALNEIDDDEKLLYDLRPREQKGKVWLVNESALYNLIFTSQKTSAIKFKKWVTKVVLPSIRKTGSFDGIDRKKQPNFITRYQDNWANVDKGYFSVIAQTYIILYSGLERHGYVIPNKAYDGREIRPDVSVGKLFASYLDANYPELAAKHKPYKHKFPDGTVFPCRQYENEIIHIFIKFVEDVWIPERAVDYLGQRDIKALDYLPKLLTGTKAA